MWVNSNMMVAFLSVAERGVASSVMYALWGPEGPGALCASAGHQDCSWCGRRVLKCRWYISAQAGIAGIGRYMLALAGTGRY